MGKIDDALSFLAVRRMNIGIYDKLDADQKEIYMNTLKREIDDEMKAKALQECIMNRYRAHYNKLLDDGEADDILPIIKEFNEDKKKKDDESVKSDYIFITINPKPTAPMGEFIKNVEKSVKKSFIKKSLHVIEQRGEDMDNLGKGFHTHILLNKGDYRISHLRREFARTFKNVCDVDNPHCFNVSLCKKQDLAKRQNYMLGNKADESKHLKQKMDIEFRKKYFLQDYYGEKFDEDISLFLAGI